MGDLARPAGLGRPALDGVVMANVLHFFRDKAPLMARMRAGVPSRRSTKAARAAESGLAETSLLARQPSRFLGEIYAALSRREGV